MFKIVSNLSQSIFLLLFFLNTNVYSQTLGELLEKILKKDESINSSKIAIDKANNDLSSVFSAFTPKIDLSIPVGNEKLINNDAVNTDLDYYEFSAKITQNIYDFGNSTSKYKNAKNKIEIAQISKDNVISNKIFEAITAYLGYIKAYEVLEYAKKSEGRIRQVTNLENEKVARGGGLASNVLQSKARLAGAKATRVRFEGELSQATNRFYNIFRELPSDIKTFKRPQLPLEYLPENESEAIRLAKENNISLNLSKINLKNSENTIKGSKSKFFPTIKAIAELKNKRNMSGIEGTEIDQTYKLEMKYPISIGGPYGLFYKERADYKSSMNQYMIAKYSHDKLERNLEEVIRNAWQTRKIAKENFEFLSNQANISGEFFDLAMKEVRLGNRQLIDILSSETAYINAKSSAETAKTQYELSIYQLLLSMGILNEEIFVRKKSKLNRNINKTKIIKKVKENKLVSNESSNEKVQKEDKAKLQKVDINLKKKNIKNKNSKKAENILNEDKIISQSDIKVNSNVDSKINKKPVIVDNIKPEAKENLVSNANNLFDERNDDKIEPSSKEEDKNFKIQLGAFSSLENAKEFISQINNQNFNNDLLVVENDRKINLYRIHSSKSFSKENAKKVCEKFINNSYNCILFKI
ncbi:MAG: hypothetical protein CM15mP20_2040 [Alphaproteobacteria bacterium]|nr:MAG: hypothetical protein CM15mP20_2040 [Alphaproteobacteria bacterium]